MKGKKEYEQGKDCEKDNYLRIKVIGEISKLYPKFMRVSQKSHVYRPKSNVKTSILEDE